jgi:hypothetical protein
MWLAAQAVFVLLLAWQFWANRFGKLNAWADAVEKKAPSWYTYKRWGDPITWIQHAMWAALAGTLGGILSLLILGAFRPGFRRFALGALVFYLAREAWSLVADVKAGNVEIDRDRIVDAIMDVVGPALVYGASYVGE